MVVTQRARRAGLRAALAVALALAWWVIAATTVWAADRSTGAGAQLVGCCLRVAAETVTGVGSGAAFPLQSEQPQAPAPDDATAPSWVPPMSFTLAVGGTAVILWGAVRGRRRRPAGD